MRLPFSFDPQQRRMAFSWVLATASVVLAIVVSGVFANARVWAHEFGSTVGCGTAWEASASTGACGGALKARAWVAVALLGVALWGALMAVVVAGGAREHRGQQVATLTVVVGLVAVAAGLSWGGVIDRGIGP